jgi:hypothetical protein
LTIGSERDPSVRPSGTGVEAGSLEVSAPFREVRATGRLSDSTIDMHRHQRASFDVRIEAGEPIAAPSGRIDARLIKATGRRDDGDVGFGCGTAAAAELRRLHVLGTAHGDYAKDEDSNDGTRDDHASPPADSHRGFSHDIFS